MRSLFNNPATWNVIGFFAILGIIIRVNADWLVAILLVLVVISNYFEGVLATRRKQQEQMEALLMRLRK